MKQKKLPLGARFGLWVLSFLLGILLFVSVVTAELIADVRVVTDRDNIRDFVVQLLTDPVQLHGRTPLRQGAGGVRLSLPSAPSFNMPRRDNTSTQTTIPNLEGIEGIEGIEDIQNQQGLSSSLGINLTEQMIEIVYDQIQTHLGEDSAITKEEITELVEQSTVTEFIAEKAADIVADYVTGEITTTFEPEEIKTLIETNKELIETVVGEPIPEEVVTQIVETVKTNEVVQKVEEKGLAGVIEMSSSSDSTTPDGEPALTPPSDNMLGEQLGSLLGSSEEGSKQVADSIANVAQTITGGELTGVKNINDIVTMLRAATSVQNLVVCMVVCVVFMLLILLVNIKQLGAGLRRCGYPMLFAGVMVIPCLLATYAPDMWTGDAYLSIAQQVLSMVTGINALVFGLGLLFVIAGILVGSITKRKLAATVAVAADVPVAVVADSAAEELSAELEETPVDAPAEATEEVE